MSVVKAEIDGQLRRLAQDLDDAPRTGADVDEPEGSRVLTLSDTAARQIAATLRMLSGLVAA